MLDTLIALLSLRMLSFSLFCLQDFLDGEQAASYLTKEIRNELVHGATLEITNRYHGLAAELVHLVSVQFPNFS